MTEKEYNNVLKAFDDAEESTRPFLVPGEDEMVVVGDANDTEVHKHDYTVAFHIPAEDGGYKTYTKKFQGVHITPRMTPRIMKLMMDLVPFFRKISEDGNLEQYSAEEKLKVYLNLGDEVFDRMYELVGAVLHIDPQLIDYIALESVLEATITIFREYPDLINGSQAFFQSLSESR